jgi:thiamine biosynthesis lipoprotein
MALQLAGQGYDRTFADIGEHTQQGESNLSDTPNSSTRSSVGCAAITIDRQASEVTLPSDVGFDPGGIGKGLAADIVARELMDADAWGVMVSLGGDLAVKGLPP